MTLSGKGDPEENRAAWKQRRRKLDDKNPWLIPAIVVVAIALIVVAVVYTVVSGSHF